MTADQARDLAKKTPSEERVMEAIRTACVMDQSGTRVPAEWVNDGLLQTLRIEGYTVTAGWYHAYEPGFIISWQA